MAADLRSIDDGRLPSGLEIVPVDDRARLMAWVEVMRVGFGLPASSIGQLVELFEPIALQPPMTTYLGLLDGQPVATSQLFLGASVAGLYNVTCLPGARGRGIGSALTRRPMVDARQLGFELVILQASQLGFPVYRRLGFEDLGRLPFYELDSVMASRS